MMKSGRSHLSRGLLAAVFVGATTLAVVTPTRQADAWWYRGGFRGGCCWRGGWGWGPGAVVGGALLGLGVGAAVAGAYAPPPAYYYSPPYYPPAPGYYAPPPGYYAPPPAPGYAPPPPR